MRPFSELPPESQAEIRQFEEYLKLKQEARRTGVSCPRFEEWRDMQPQAVPGEPPPRQVKPHTPGAFYPGHTPGQEDTP